MTPPPEAGPSPAPETGAAPIWAPTPARAAATAMAQFTKLAGERTGRVYKTYSELWNWSNERPGDFWSMLWEFAGIVGDRGPSAMAFTNQMPGAQFFPQARLNYAENLLRRKDDQAAIIFRPESGPERQLTYDELYKSVSLWIQALRAAGVGEGDRVAGYMPNMPETIIAMLAATSIGAIWSSASPDFGVQGLVDRFGQIEPKILVCVDGYHYGGKELDCLAKVREAQQKIGGLQKIVVVPFLRGNPDLAGIENGVALADFLKAYKPGKIRFTRVAFNHPLLIMFSSGTTGAPKCIVHGHGGTLLQLVKEHRLHSDIRPGDRVFYYTTCGWMMWNWLATALASEATLMLYDGSPFHPDGYALWDFASRHGCRLFGTSAKYIDALKSHGLEPGKRHDLSKLDTIASTGSPLVHESFDYVYSAIKKDVHLASISGGTDIVSCFVLGNPVAPVYRGEIQCAGLGLDVDVFDDDGRPVPPGASGELVCKKPFPSMPVKFWNDPDGKKYREAYFERFPGVWCHGDWVEKTLNGGYVIHGRSDATLNPGGVRIGTAEIYRQVEQVPEVLESMAVGQDWQGDVRIILFVVLKNGMRLSDTLQAAIRNRIRAGASPRHVPAKIIQVADLPRTKSGKITELAVRHIIHGRPVKNVEALANPQALDLFRELAELKE